MKEMDDIEMRQPTLRDVIEHEDVSPESTAQMISTGALTREGVQSTSEGMMSETRQMSTFRWRLVLHILKGLLESMATLRAPGDQPWSR